MQGSIDRPNQTPLLDSCQTRIHISSIQRVVGHALKRELRNIVIVKTLIRSSLLALDMRQDTAIRRLTKRANDFLGMSLNDYLIKFTYQTTYGDSETLFWTMNDNHSMQKCWYALGCPVNAEEAHSLMPRLDAPLTPREA